MVTKLFVPDRRIVVPKPPSYLKLDLAMDAASDSYVYDKSRYRSHGAITGASWATGAHGKALDFVSATPSYVEIAAAYDQLNFTSEKFSAIIRIYIDSLTADAWLLNRGEVAADGWMWYAESTGRLIARTDQSGVGQISYTAVGVVTTATWYTFGISRDGSSIINYANGVAKVEAGGTHIDPDSCSRSLKVGIRDDKVSAPFDGKIEFLRIIGGIALPASAHLAWHNALA